MLARSYTIAIVLSGCAMEMPAEWDRPDATEAEDARVEPSQGAAPGASMMGARERAEDPLGAALDRPAALATQVADMSHEACLARADRGARPCVYRPESEGWVPEEPVRLGPPYRGWTLEVTTRRGVHRVLLVAPSRRASYLLGRVPATRGCTEDGLGLRDRHAVPPHWRERRAPPAFDAAIAAARVQDAGASIEVELDESFTGCGDCGCACGGGWPVEPVRRDEPVRLAVPRAARALASSEPENQPSVRYDAHP